MTVSAEIMSLKGIDAASVVMASATNIDNLKEAGLGPFDVRPNDLLVALSGTSEACEEGLEQADGLLTKPASSDGTATAAAEPVTSSRMAVAEDPSRTFALVSAPGDY